MAQRLALDAPDLVAAVATFGGYALKGPGATFQPRPILHVHGTDDTVVEYAKPCDCASDAETCFASCDSVYSENAALNLERWKNWNACNGLDETLVEAEDYTARTYTNCLGGVEVALVTLPGVQHYPYMDRYGLYPGWPEADVDTTQMAWDFIRRYTNTYDASWAYDWTTATPPAQNVSASDASAASDTISSARARGGPALFAALLLVAAALLS